MTGDGPNATLDLTGVAPGTYTVTVKVEDDRGGAAFATAKIDVSRCTCPLPVVMSPSCPTVTVSCPSDSVKPGTPITFTVNVSGGDTNATPTYNWTVSAGTIMSGQGTNSVTVDTTGLPSSFVTGTVEVGGYDRSCSTSASCTYSPGCVLGLPRKIDEYGGIRFKDEKARLDKFAVELQNDPTAQGYLVCYGGRRSRAGEARRRCDRAMRYTSTHFGDFEGLRLVTVDGGYREESAVELWIAPSGSTPPAASPTVDPSEVKPPVPARRRRGTLSGKKD